MGYRTRRGEFGSLQILRAAYIEAPDRFKYRLLQEDASWDKSVLHASDTSGCPRAVMYRLLGTPEKPRSKKAAANRIVMLERGTDYHWLTYSALNWAGILVGHEIPAAPREGWAGSMDALIRPNHESDSVVGFDEKTVLPNMLIYHRADTPKDKDCTQLGAYCLTQPFKWGLIEYTDRAGSNNPEECEFDASQWMEKAVERMDALEMWQGLLPELPPTLEPEFVAHYSDHKLDSVTSERPWSCDYCDFHLTKKERRINPASGRMKEYGWTCSDSTCKPVNVPPRIVAEVKNGAWRYREESEELHEFLDAQVKTIPIYDEEG